MRSITIEKGQVLTMQLDNVSEFAKQYPELYDAIVECSAFINWRRMENGNQPPVLAVSFNRNLNN